MTSRLSKCIIFVYNVFHSPLPVNDGRLVSYFINKNGLSWHSFPMSNVTHIDMFNEYNDRILIEETYDNNISYTTVVYENKEIANNEYKRLIKLKEKFSGIPYNCGEVTMPEKIN